MHPELQVYLERAQQAIQKPAGNGYRGPVHVGVDLGTAYTVLFVLDAEKQPLAGAYEFAQIVRDGLVVDFNQATLLVKKLKHQLEEKLGFELTSAATSFPPGVPAAEIRANRYVLEAAGLECTGMVDEPSAANLVLKIENGAVVDIGGGTTGIAIVKDGEVIYTADEPTGGTHFTLVISGGLKIPFMEAEHLKTNVKEQPRLFPAVRPVMEKVGTIVERHIRPYAVDHIYLVGGTSAFLGIADVIANITGVPTSVPVNPLFVTPLGVALYHESLPGG